MKVRYIRTGDVLDERDQVVVRGGDLEPEVIRADAQRTFDVYGMYGISVFSLRDVTVDELGQKPPLVRFAQLAVVTVGTIRSAGLWLEPTGRNSPPYTLVLPHLSPPAPPLSS